MTTGLKIGLYSMASAILLLGLVAFSMWRSHVAERNLEVMNFAHSELSGYLGLSASIYKHFKHARRDLLGPGASLTFDLYTTQEQIESSLLKIRQLEFQEMQLNSEQTFDEISVIEEISHEVRLAFQDIQHATGLLAAGDEEEARIVLNDSFTQRIDGRVSSLIEQVVSHEKEQLEAVRRDAKRINEVAITITAAIGILTLVMSLSLAYYLAFRHPKKIAALNDGISKFATGDLDFRISERGTDEFARMAANLNSMAAQLKHERYVRSQITKTLEETVKSRTEELEKANLELRTREQMRTQFLTDIGHELRTPVTVIRGEAEVSRLGHDLSFEDLQRSMCRIEKASEELGKFIEDVFYLARQKSGLDRAELIETNINDLCDEVVKQMAPMVIRNGGTLSFNPTTETALALVDDTKLRRVISIVVNNAIQHSHPDVSISITVDQDKGNWKIGCHDNGPGIADVDKHMVFDRFVRGSTGSSHGSGIGLALARAIVNSHGGKIWIDPDKRDGTSMYFTVPSIQ